MATNTIKLNKKTWTETLTSPGRWQVVANKTVLYVESETMPTTVDDYFIAIPGQINEFTQRDTTLWTYSLKNNVSITVDTGSSMDVVVQDQTSPLFQYYLINEQKTDITLTADVSVDDTVISVSAGHGFTGAAGEYIVLFENNQEGQFKVISVATNDITIEYPSAQVFTVAGCQVIRGNVNMNVNGSSTEVVFNMKLRNFTIPIDIGKAIITMSHPLAGDDGKFGGIAELTNGVYFRKNNTEKFNLGNYINNQAFKNVGGTVKYAAKGPGGIEATDIIFDIKEIFGQVIRFDCCDNDVFEAHVRDNLTGLSSFTMSLIGSYTEGE
jgi:hypothetical protein